MAALRINTSIKVNLNLIEERILKTGWTDIDWLSWWESYRLHWNRYESRI